MTKTKKIICIALALLMIAGAIIFAVYNKVGKNYNYAKIKDYSKYITIGDVMGLTFEADDCEIAPVTDEDVQQQVAANLRALMTDDDKNVTDTNAVIGTYDEVYVNFYGSYVDEGSVTHIFVAGSRMDKENPVVLYVESGAASEYFANSLKGKSPNPGAYTLKATDPDDENDVIDADDIVYINYTWVRYLYATDENGDRVQDENGKDTVDVESKQTNSTVDANTNRVTTELRLDLANVPDYFPATFKDQIVGKKAGSLGTLTFDNVEVDLGGEEGVKQFRYEYTVTVNRVIGTFDAIEIPYTFAADATDKDLEGNALAGKDVTFHIVIAKFNDVPDLDKTYPVDPSDENSEQINVIRSKLKFDETSYYTENVKTETDWLAENEGKTHDDYVEYLKGQYVEYVKKQLIDSYDSKRMNAAAKPMWEKIREQVTAVNAPKRAVKLTKKDVESMFKYVFNNGTFENESGKTVSYRTQYGSYKKFMAACYTNEDVIKSVGLDTNAAYKKAVEDGKSYGECIDAAVTEIVTNKLLMYALYNKFGDAVKVDEAEFESERSLMYMYYYYGLSNTVLPDSAIRESIMFDNVMEYIYDNANVQWESEGANP